MLRDVAETAVDKPMGPVLKSLAARCDSCVAGDPLLMKRFYLLRFLCYFGLAHEMSASRGDPVFAWVSQLLLTVRTCPWQLFRPEFQSRLLQDTRRVFQTDRDIALQMVMGIVDKHDIHMDTIGDIVQCYPTFGKV